MPDQDQDKVVQRLLSIINKLMWVVVILVVAIVAMPFILFNIDDSSTEEKKIVAADTDTTKYWIAPEISTITDTSKRSLVEYGKELIAHTAKYLGPRGSVMQISNGMN